MWTPDFIVVNYFAFGFCRPWNPPIYKMMTVNINCVHIKNKIVRTATFLLKCKIFKVAIFNMLHTSPTLTSAIFKDVYSITIGVALLDSMLCDMLSAETFHSRNLRRRV